MRALEDAGDLVAVAHLEGRAELLKRMEVRIEPATPDHVAAGRRNDCAPVACEQGSGEQKRRADLARQLGVDVVADVCGMNTHLVRTDPLDVGAEVGEQAAHRLHVADARDVGERDRLVRQQARGQDRQRAVLVPRSTHMAGERVAPLDHERFRQGPDDGRGHRSALC